MPTEAEVRVMTMLSGIEVPRTAGDAIAALGNEAVTVVCEAALGAYAGVRDKVRTNAVSVLGGIDHPQAKETIALLVTDDEPDIAVRAMRSAAAQGNAIAVPRLDDVLRRPASSPILAAEAVSALRAIDTPAARESLERYRAATDGAPAHRQSPVVREMLAQQPDRRASAT